MTVTGVVILIALAALLVLIFRAKLRVADSAPGARWRRTDEVFRDPRTGRTVRVWIDPLDGSRHHVPERGNRSSS